MPSPMILDSPFLESWMSKTGAMLDLLIEAVLMLWMLVICQCSSGFLWVVYRFGTLHLHGRMPCLECSPGVKCPCGPWLGQAKKRRSDAALFGDACCSSHLGFLTTKPWKPWDTGTAGYGLPWKLDSVGKIVSFSSLGKRCPGRCLLISVVCVVRKPEDPSRSFLFYLFFQPRRACPGVKLQDNMGREARPANHGKISPPGSFEYMSKPTNII